MELLGQVVLSQATLHERFGGVVPEIACRSHVESLTSVVEQCLSECGVTPDALAGVAVANRPGLIGALLVGITTAKALAWAWQVPLVGVDHLEAHLMAAALDGRDVPVPHLGVILSGGHTDIYVVEEEGRERIGCTQDDAIGEAFDKVASILGLGYPGGPRIEEEARAGDASRVPLPRTLLAPDSLDFSFSGIKTAVLYLWCGQNGRPPGPVPGAPSRADIAASFQEAVTVVVVEKIRRALARTGLRHVVLGGGVTANRFLRDCIASDLDDRVDSIIVPRIELCTDNGAMIAACGLERLERGEHDPLTLEASAS